MTDKATRAGNGPESEAWAKAYASLLALVALVFLIFLAKGMYLAIALLLAASVVTAVLAHRLARRLR